MDRKRLGRETSSQAWVLEGTACIGQFTMSMVNLSVVYYLKLDFGLSSSMIGIATSLYTASYFLCCLIGDRFYARLKPRHTIMSATFGMAVAVLLLVLSVDWRMIFLCLVAYGACMSMLWPQLAGWLSRGKEGPELNAATSRYNLSWSIGFCISPYVTGILVEGSTHLPLYVGSCIFAGLAVLIVGTSRILPTMRDAEPEQSFQTVPMPGRETSLRFLCWAGVVPMYYALSIVQTVFPQYAQDFLQVPESWTGFLLLLCGIATCIAFLYLGRYHWWQFKLPLILGVQCMLIVLCLIGLEIPSLMGYCLFFFMFGLVFASTYTMSMFHGVSGSRYRSRRMMIHEVLLTVGTILGASVGGMIYGRFGYRTALGSCVTLNCIVMFFELIGLFVWRHNTKLRSKNQTG